MSGEMMVVRKDIVAALRQLGLAAGDCVMAHSSLSRFGQVEGGAETVIAALLEALHPGGTLVMPTLSQRDKERRFETWNIDASPSDVGKITEVFRQRKDTIRSDHATHSVASAGPLAVEITAGHRQAAARPGPWGDAAFAATSPWQKLYALDATIVLLGVDLKVNTMVHFIEHLLVERALSRIPVDQRGQLQDQIAGWGQPGVWPYYDRIKLQEEMVRQGHLADSQCGKARLLAVPAQTMVDSALALMEKSPRDWFETPFCEWYERATS